jgi:hypothetical protein
VPDLKEIKFQVSNTVAKRRIAVFTAIKMGYVVFLVVACSTTLVGGNYLFEPTYRFHLQLIP